MRRAILTLVALWVGDQIAYRARAIAEFRRIERAAYAALAGSSAAMRVLINPGVCDVIFGWDDQWTCQLPAGHDGLHSADSADVVRRTMRCHAFIPASRLSSSSPRAGCHCALPLGHRGNHGCKHVLPPWDFEQ